MSSEIQISLLSKLIAFFKNNLTSAVVTAILVALLSITFWCLSSLNESNSYQYPKRRLSQLYNTLLQNDEETSNIDQKQPLELIVEEFRLRKEEEEERLLESTDEYDNIPKKNVLSSSWSLLKTLSLRLQNSDERKSAAMLNVHTLTLDFILKSLPTTEHNKVSAAIDIVNGLLQTKEAINLLCDDIKMTKLVVFIDTLLSIIKIYCSYTTKASMFYIDEDTAGNVVDIGMIDFFTEHGYKFILALGLLVADNPDVKTVCADRDSILTVLECLKQQRLSPSLSKWCIWSLMNICFEHPPNKSVFVQKNGLTIVLGSLRHHASNADVQKQGLSLLSYVLSDDMQSKFHLKDARKTALSLGIITIIEAAQINYKEECTIQEPCKYLLQLMAAEYS